MAQPLTKSTCREEYGRSVERTPWGVDVMDYDSDWSRYRIRLAKGDVQKHEKLLKDLLRQSYEESQR